MLSCLRAGNSTCAQACFAVSPILCMTLCHARWSQSDMHLFNPDAIMLWPPCLSPGLVFQRNPWCTMCPMYHPSASQSAWTALGVTLTAPPCGWTASSQHRTECLAPCPPQSTVQCVSQPGSPAATQDGSVSKAQHGWAQQSRAWRGTAGLSTAYIDRLQHASEARKPLFYSDLLHR